MLYLAATSSSLENRHPKLGVMIGPRVGGLRPIIEGRLWGGDNDAFNNFDSGKFMKHLKRMQSFQSTCLFFAAPDVVGNAVETMNQFKGWAEIIKDHGFPVAYVAQDGAEHLELPDCDAVFIGGSTEWKLSKESEAIMHEAKQSNKWLHVGRVNSLKRCLWADHHGADSVDGTHLSFAGAVGVNAGGMYDLESWVTTIQYQKENRLCFS